MTLTRAAAKHLARAGYDPVYGARPLARVIREKVEDPLASELLFGRLKNGGKVTIDAASGAKSEKKPGGEKAPVLCFHYETPAKNARGEKTRTKSAAAFSARKMEDLADSPAG